MRYIYAFLLLALLGSHAVAANAPAASPKPPLVRNLLTDYHVSAGGPGNIADAIQKAVDEVGAAGGGTVIIPGDDRWYMLDHPVFVGYPNVTITGEGTTTRLAGTPTMFILGAKAQYAQAITPRHYPPITDNGALDDSVHNRFGLRTFDGTTSAAGFFPVCPLAQGGRIQTRPGDIYWTDYERGVGKPTYWRDEPCYTINLAVKNNGTGVMKGVVCGVGPGGLTPATSKGNIADPLTVWTVESGPATGQNLAFRFKSVDAQGNEKTHALLLSASPVGQGLARISVQLDFTTGACRAWFSLSSEKPLRPVLTAKLDLGTGRTFKAFQYGAFRLGAVTEQPFSGSPSDRTATNGDWTYCGLALFKTAQFSLKGGNDELGAVQKKAADDATVPTDAERYFPPCGNPALVSMLPLDRQPANILVAYQNGNGCDGTTGFGYWLPSRPQQPLPGVCTVKNMSLFAGGAGGAAITLAEAQHVVLEDIYEGGCTAQGVGSWDCNPPNALVELRNCRLVGTDAMYYGKSQLLQMSNVSGGSADTDFRLVGCQGEITDVIITGFLAADYYLKEYAGPYGGPLTITYFVIDNEGFGYVPKKACFYAEPSLNPGKGGNLLTFHGGIYTGYMPPNSAVVELADPPGVVDAVVKGMVAVDYIDLMSDQRKPCESIIRCNTPRWSGRLNNVSTAWMQAPLLSYGLIRYTGPGQCNIVSVDQESGALPAKGSWLAGCHLVHIPTQQDPLTGAWRFTSYRCTQSGTYGTDKEPKWEAERGTGF